MKKLHIAIVGVVLIAAIASFLKTNPTTQTLEEDHHYVLLQANGSIISAHKPLKFEEIEWRDYAGDGNVFLPFLDGYPILCKIGDEKGAMYTYHPFSASNQTDFKHNSATIPSSDLNCFIKKGLDKVSAETIDYQVVVKVKREIGGVESIPRGLIEGSLHL